ncbi:unnamed protein product [Adineta steineri]|uniref:Uncharacterized protein n=1 Tax=Adineta steineri TaxID=433720 RepID=A0A813QLF6_9BILA|nr:unnamed protein product [Adineta steineri]CAF0769451.1 unnamed protein product [Adineta steineri]
MEIYWPLGLIISTMSVLHIYGTFEAYRELSKHHQSVKKAYNKAKLNLLEVKSEPHKLAPLEVEGGSPDIERFIKKEEWNSISTQKSITPALTSTESKTVCQYIRSSYGCSIIFCIMCLILAGLATLHALVPTIYRLGIEHETFLADTWQINYIRISYIVLSGIFGFIAMVMMTFSIGNYIRILNNLKILLSSTELSQTIDLERLYFLNLREPKNLEYFLSLFRPIIRNIDSYYVCLSTMTCAIVIDLILIITAVVHVFVYGYSGTLLMFWCLIDIIILSIFILLFLGIVVLINKLLTHDFIRQLKALKKSMVTPSSSDRNCRDTICYLDAVIDHIECASREYAVKILGFVIDQKLVIKVFISICTGIGSSIVSFVKNR